MGVDRFLARLTAVAGPYYEERSPAPDLANVLACVWVRVVRLKPGEQRTAIFPDGCADILVHDDGPPFVAGPDAATRWVKLRDGAVVVGVRIRPGAVRSVFGFHADVLLDRGVLLSDVAPGARRLHEHLSASENLDARHALLEDWVRSARVSTRDAEVIEACRLLAMAPASVVGAVARRVGWNERKLHRQFKAAVGYGPKHFQRIMRVQRSIRLAADGRLGLADIAQAAGYADQPHMTRDFRDITGFSAKTGLAVAHSEVSAWLDADW
jgi:AraC-like DNA-binding protein